MKIVIAGGSGFLGTCLTEYYSQNGHEIIILTRGTTRANGMVRYITWDGKHLTPWTAALDGADVLINLNGKSVDCRYTEKNKQLIYSTRIDSTRVLGEAIQKSVNPPRLWINAGSATIYRHSLDKEMDEYTGEIGSGFSVDVCQKWEQCFNEFELRSTRKVIIRTGIVLGRMGPLTPLRILARLGMGGKQGPGTQYFSWLHESDFVGIVDHLISNTKMNGIFNVTAPHPVPNEHFMKALRKALGIPVGIPLPTWLLEFGAMLISTETELILKSRKVVPRRLLESGYSFRFDSIEAALMDLA